MGPVGAEVQIFSSRPISAHLSNGGIRHQAGMSRTANHNRMIGAIIKTEGIALT
jgi:hypothetical protein